jgi:hypothetical protein
MNTTHTKIPQILKSKGSQFDGHMWVELYMKDGTTQILDYDTDQFEGVSLYGKRWDTWTGELDYKPFPKEIEKLIGNNRLKQAINKISFMKKNNSPKDFQAWGQVVLNTPGFCTIRVALFDVGQQQKKEKMNEWFEKTGVKSYQIRCGSLGFIQKNGDIFYEYG